MNNQSRWVAGHGEEGGSLRSLHGLPTLNIIGVFMDGTCHLSTKFIRTGNTQFLVSVYYQPEWPSGLPSSYEVIAEGPLFIHEDLRHETDLQL